MSETTKKNDQTNTDLRQPAFSGSSKTSGNETSKPKGGFIKKNPVLFTVLVALLVIVVVFFWKDIQGKKVKRDVVRTANEQLLQNNHEMLALLCKPFVWSVRAEMMRGNLEQVDLFMSDLVKERNFRYIHLVEPGGNVLLSTNKRLEGQNAGDEIEASWLTADSIMVEDLGETTVVAAPVMGFDRRLATIIFTYEVESFEY
jgi:hypothetical protein